MVGCYLLAIVGLVDGGTYVYAAPRRLDHIGQFGDFCEYGLYGDLYCCFLVVVISFFVVGCLCCLLM